MIRLILLLLFALLTVESFNTSVTQRWHFARNNNRTEGNLTELRVTIQPMKKSTTRPRTTMDIDDDDIDDDEEEVIHDGINTDDLPSDTEPEEMDPVGPMKYDEQLKQLYPTLDPTTKRANMELCFMKRVKVICYIGDGCLSDDEYPVHTKFVKLRKKHQFNERAKKCDVAVVIHVKSEQTQRGHGIVEYHTTNKYLNLYVPLTEYTKDNFAVVKDGELKCIGECSIYFGKPFYKDSTSYYFHSNLHYWSDVPEKADLAWCFKRLETRCFIGDGCLTVTEDVEEEHKNIIFVTSEVKEKLLSNYSLWTEAEDCSIGASFVPTDKKGKYSFSYHTYANKINLLLNFTNREIAINKNGTLTCSSKLANKGCKIQTNSVPVLYRGVFFSGEIYLYQKRTSVPSKEAKVNNSREHSSTMVDSKRISNVKNEDIKKEKESNIGTITLIAISSLFACIIIAIIGGIIYQRVTTARNNRRKAALEATIKSSVVEKAPPIAVQWDKIPVGNSDPTSEISARGD